MDRIELWCERQEKLSENERKVAYPVVRFDVEEDVAKKLSIIHVRTRRAGQRVMAPVSRFLREGLRLKVNEAKSAVERPWKRKFLGYSLTHHKAAKMKVAVESVRRFKDKVKERFGAGRWQEAIEAATRDMIGQLAAQTPAGRL